MSEPNRAAIEAPQPTQSDEEAWTELCEKDDRTSPPEYANMALIAEWEFKGYLAAVRAEATLAGAAAEREACAKVIEDHSILFCGGGPNELKKRIGGDITGLTYAAAIRARKP